MSIFDTKKHDFTEVKEIGSIDDILKKCPSENFKNNWKSYLRELHSCSDLTEDSLKQIVDIAYNVYDGTNLILNLKGSKHYDQILPEHQFGTDLKFDDEDFCILYGFIEDRNKPEVGLFFLGDKKVSDMVEYLCREKIKFPEFGFY